MKRRKLYIVWCILAMVSFMPAASAFDEEDYFLPEELQGASIYVEKFSPIYFQDLTPEDVERISGDKNDERRMSEFLEFLRAYNLVFYRKLNEHIETNIKSMKNSGRFIPMYERDFHEAADTGTRFLIKNDFSIVDIYAEKDKYFTNDDLQNTFSYYILDKQTGTQYKRVLNVEELMMKVDHFYSLERKNKLDKMSRTALHKSLQSVKPKKDKRRIGGPSLGIIFFSGLSLVLNFLLNA